jgi:hypothetical protein
LTETKCFADCLKCVDSNKGCLLCIPGYKLIGNKCFAPQKMYLNLLSEDTLKLPIVLKTIDSSKNFDISKMNQLTLTITIKIINFTKLNANFNKECVEIILLTKDLGRKICYNNEDDSLNLMEYGTIAFKFLNFSRYFGEFIVISVAFNSKYIYNETNQTYNVDPKVGKDWRNYYAFYINEIPVQPFREFDYENKINNISLFFNRIELGNRVWAYLSDIKIYKGFYTNPISLVTHNRSFEYLVKTYSFTTSIVEKKSKILKAPVPTSLNQQFCLLDADIDFFFYSNIKANFAFYNKNYCVSDFDIKFERVCSGNTFYDFKSLSNPTCSPCSISCSSECGFKGINGCTNNYLDLNAFQKYTNYDSSILLSATSDINKNYYFSNNIESRKIIMNDMSKYKYIKMASLKQGEAKKYSIEFWFYIYMHGHGSVTKSNNNNALPFDKQEIIWDNHNKIVIENINNEIFVTCYPVFDDVDPLNSLYKKANEEYEKYKITYKMSEILYKKSKWAYINCSTDLEEGKASFNNKQIDLKINIDNQLDSPFYYLYQIRNKLLSNSYLIIQYGNNARTNYGALFLEEFRLWDSLTVTENKLDCM